MARGYGPPVMDFAGMLSGLGTAFNQGFDRSRARAEEDLQKQAIAEQARALSGGLGAPAAPGMSLSALSPAPPVPEPSAPSINGSGRARTMTMPVTPDVKEGIVATATALGIDPVDLATAISYETAGTFSPTKAGPTTQWGQHRGLIQFGEPQAREHGVDWSNPVGSQLGPNGAVANYLRKAGVQPGMGLLDVYSAINAGRVGLYDRTDANNGGAPGTVRDKVERQMADHRQKAMALLGAADAPAPGASAAQFAVPGQGGGAPVVDQSAGRQIPPQIQAMLQSQNPYVKAQGVKMAQELQKRPAYSQTTDAEGNIWQRSSDGQLQLVRQAPDRFTTETDEQGNQIQINQRTGARSVLRPAQEQTRTLKPEEFAQYGVDPEYRGPVQLTSKGELKFPGKASTQITNTVGAGEGEFEKTAGKKQAERLDALVTAGDAAQQRLSDIGTLREASRNVGSQGSSANAKLAFGPYLEAAGINIEGLSDIQLFDSVAKRLAPQLRPAGSGSTSDVEYKGFVASLGSLSNNPAAREMILDTFEAAARNEIVRGEIATRVFNKEITRAEGEKQLRSLPNPLEAFREYRKANPDEVGAAIRAGRDSDKKPAAGKQDQDGWTSFGDVRIREKR